MLLLIAVWEPAWAHSSLLVLDCKCFQLDFAGIKAQEARSRVLCTISEPSLGEVSFSLPEEGTTGDVRQFGDFFILREWR